MDASAASPAAARRAIPVTVLGGFLGAGKTTLLNRILQGDHGLRIAVLVNDFGSINIDAELVVGIEGNGEVMSLTNGCVCCSIRDDLLGAVQQVIARPERPDCIVLEASGVAEPSSIAMTFLDPALREQIRLDSIMCVVDASQVFEAPELMELKLRQIAYADMLILNKIDLVAPGQIARICAWLDEHFHRYRLVQASHGQVPLEILLSAGRLDPLQHPPAFSAPLVPRLGAVGLAGSPQPSRFATWSYESDVPICLERLHAAMRKLPTSIYRCKGVIACDDSPHRRTVLQVVGKRVDLVPGEAWGDRPALTRIVVIKKTDGPDARTLQAIFDACRADPMS